jgi:hypothetical protein
MVVSTNLKNIPYFLLEWKAARKHDFNLRIRFEAVLPKAFFNIAVITAVFRYLTFEEGGTSFKEFREL